MVTLLTLGALAACDNNKTPEKPKEAVKIDPGAILYVNPAPTKADEPYTAEYIVTNTAFVNRYLISYDLHGQMSLGLSENDYLSSRDLINHKFIFSGTDVVKEDGTPGSFFNWEEMTFTVAVVDGKQVHPIEGGVIWHLNDLVEDTIAYIPKAVARKCKADVLAALEAGDLEECYRIFKEDFVFKPIENGAAWRKLKAEGIE